MTLQHPISKIQPLALTDDNALLALCEKKLLLKEAAELFCKVRVSLQLDKLPGRKVVWQLGNHAVTQLKENARVLPSHLFLTMLAYLHLGGRWVETLFQFLALIRPLGCQPKLLQLYHNCVPLLEMICPLIFHKYWLVVWLHLAVAGN